MVSIGSNASSSPPNVRRRNAACRRWAPTCWVVGVLWLVTVGRAEAQSDNPAPDWDPPYCSEQPRITAVYDNDVPLYGRNGRTVLFSGRDVQPCDLQYDGHSGWDYARSGGRQACGGGERPAFASSIVLASASGTVRRSRWFAERHDGNAAGYGLHLDVHAADGGHGELSHLYGHLATVFVEEGAAVEKGQPIGAVGTTGNSTGPHLHFQGAKGGRGDVSDQTFDVFGWNARFDSGYRYPGVPQPHRGNGWPMRVYVPSAAGPPCPASCDERVVEEDDPAVRRGCAAGDTPADCPFWFRDPRGRGGGHFWTHPNGSSKDYWIRYRCPGCAPGAYLVEAFVPFGADISNTHIARWEVGDRVSVMDQHQEGDRWQPVGVFTFEGEPAVELNDRTDRYDYVAPADMRIGADAVRFRRVGCGGGGGGGFSGGSGDGGTSTPMTTASPASTKSATPNVPTTPTAYDARTTTPSIATGEPH